MDDYIEYQIINGEGEFGDSSDDNSGGCMIWVLIIIVVLWIIIKMLS